jgi:hypothetical protein
MTSKSFKDIALGLGELVTEKNAAYGDATKTGAEAMRKLFPNGVKPEQYEDFGYCLLVWHKLSRVATNPEAFGENPKQDIAGYSILALTREQRGTPTNGPKEHLPLKLNQWFVCEKCGQEMANKGSGDSWVKHLCWPCWHPIYPLVNQDGWREIANEREIKEVEALLNPDREIELLARKLSAPGLSAQLCAACNGGPRDAHTCIYGSPA